MPSIALPYSPRSLATALVALLTVVYIALIAVVMSYATLTVEFAESVRNGEAEVATLEAEYLAMVSAISTSDYRAAGYVKPSAKTFVAAERGTALR